MVRKSELLHISCVLAADPAVSVDFSSICSHLACKLHMAWFLHSRSVPFRHLCRIEVSRLQYLCKCSGGGWFQYRCRISAIPVQGSCQDELFNDFKGLRGLLRVLC